MIPYGTNPKKLVKKMKLAHASPKLKTNTKTISWTSPPLTTVLANWDDLLKDDNILAIWTNIENQQAVVAWVDP